VSNTLSPRSREHDVAVAAAGEHQHPHAAVALQQHPGELDARRVAPAEVDVEHDEVGRAAVGDDEGVARRRGLTDHGDLGVGGEQLAQAEADDRLAVDDQQARGPADGAVVAARERCAVENGGLPVENGVGRHGGTSLGPKVVAHVTCGSEGP
jgi:hypothetical protein